MDNEKNKISACMQEVINSLPKKERNADSIQKALCKDPKYVELIKKLSEEK